nr:TVP38/TMEM64 family protein [Cohnella hashimotonis]
MLSFGWIAPAVYIGLFVARPFVLFPASVLTLAGGLAFGTWYGMLYTFLGEIPGAVLSFLLARQVGLGFFKGRDDPRLRKLEGAMQRRGFPMVLMLRIAPFVPFDLVSYAAGAARVPLRAYVPATVIGTLPGTFAFCFLGASLTRGDWREIALAIAVFAAAMLVPLLLKRRVRREVG